MTVSSKKTKYLTIIGLTGSIGMGKSTAAAILHDMGFPIYSADDAVHDLLKKGGKGVRPVAHLFPESLKHGAIDRKKVGQSIFGQPEKLQQLERIIHPLLRHAERIFLKKARKDKAPAAILEIPLLFETGGEERCDYTFCVTAPRAIQKKQAIAHRARQGRSGADRGFQPAQPDPSLVGRHRIDRRPPVALGPGEACIDCALMKLG